MDTLTLTNSTVRLTVRLISTLVGLLLLCTACMKLYDLLYGDAAALLWLPSPRWILSAVEVEALIGLWLLSGWYSRWAFRIAMVLFVGLAAISAYLGITGQSSCGCFGRVEINPWWMFAFDLITLTALLQFRPLHEEATSPWSWIRQVLLSIAGAVLILSSISIVILLFGANPMRILAQMRGETLLIDPLVYDAGSGTPGELRTITINLINTGEQPIRIEGGTSSCACMTTADLPVTIGPGESKPISIRIKFTGSNGRFQQRYILYTDDRKRQTVTARFTGSVKLHDSIPIASAIGRQ